MSHLARIVLTLFFVLITANSASAHFLWLEQDTKGVRLYFGEFGSNLREVSPGVMDRIEPTAVVAGSKGSPLKVEKTATAFVLSGAIGKQDSIIAQDLRYPIATRKTGETTVRSLYHPAARFVPDRAARETVLDLDVVPGVAADTFKVVFKGQPLAAAKFTLSSVSGWSREYATNADGIVTAQLPWRGLYVIEVLHNDKTPGKRGEEAYDVTNYITSLSFVEPKGLEASPAPPFATPNK